MLTCPTEAIAWVAGLFEGEGTLNISYDVHGWHGVVAIDQKDPEILYEVQKLFDGNVRSTSSGIWRWERYGKRALPFLEIVLPHVRGTFRKKEMIVYRAFWEIDSKNLHERTKLLAWWRKRKILHRRK